MSIVTIISIRNKAAFGATFSNLMYKIRILMLSFVLSAACMEKFPGTPKGVLGAAINGKLTELRIKSKKLDATEAAGTSHQ